MGFWSEHVAQGEAFSSQHFIIGVGGLFAHMQLFNPVGSGIRVRIRSVRHIGTTTVQSNIRRHDLPVAILGPPAPFIIENILGGGPAAVAELRHASLVALTGTPFWLLQAPSHTPAIYPVKGLAWGHDLLEGQGVLLSGQPGRTTIVNWMWVELPL